MSTNRWMKSDYSKEKGFSRGVNFLTKDLVFGSILTESEDIFGEISYSESKIEVPPIPGKYPYDRDWFSWGGDDQLTIGQYYYPTFITSFGLVGLNATHSYYSSDGRDLLAERKLQRLLEGSRLILNWFAGLVDKDGSKIAYDQKSKAGNLKNMLSMLINSDQEVDLNMVYNQLDMFTKDMPQDVKFYVGSLREYLTKVLREGKIRFLSWKSLLEIRQYGMLSCYSWFKNYESSAIDHSTLNDNIHEFIETSNQMAAFFILFLHVELMLDVILDMKGESGSAVPSKNRLVILKDICEKLPGLFLLNTIYYRDLALLYKEDYKDQDLDKILKIELTQIDYCDQISIRLGLIFKIFDHIVRGRNLYQM